MDQTFYLYRDENINSNIPKLYLSIENGRVTYSANIANASVISIKSLDMLIHGNNFIYYSTTDSEGTEFFFRIINTSFEVYTLSESEIDEFIRNPMLVRQLTTKNYTTLNLPVVETSKTLFSANDTAYRLDPYNVGQYKIHLIGQTLTIVDDFIEIGEFIFEDISYKVFKSNRPISFTDYYKFDMDTPDINFYGFGNPRFDTWTMDKLFRTFFTF